MLRRKVESYRVRKLRQRHDVFGSSIAGEETESCLSVHNNDIDLSW
jgi:hypothetical protein